MIKRLSTTSDEELIIRFKKGHKSAFDELYRRYSGLLLALMCRLLNQDRELAHDVLHDVFVRLIEHPTKFDTNKRFKPWIYTVATNECRKQFRKHQHTHIDDVQEHYFARDPMVIDKMNDVHFNQSLQKSLNELSFEHKCCFVLRYQERLTIKEISEVIDCPEGTVKSRIHHSIKLLNQKLSQFNPNNTETYEAKRR